MDVYLVLIFAGAARSFAAQEGHLSLELVKNKPGISYCLHAGVNSNQHGTVNFPSVRKQIYAEGCYGLSILQVLQAYLIRLCVVCIALNSDFGCSVGSMFHTCRSDLVVPFDFDWLVQLAK